MTRTFLIASIGALSLGVAACGGYEENKAAYDEQNAAYEANTVYDENTAYDAGNAAYNASDGNAAYAPPPDGNVSDNVVAPVPPTGPTTNGY